MMIMAVQEQRRRIFFACNYSPSRAINLPAYTSSLLLILCTSTVTTQEFTEYLRRIRDNDVNGNGDKNDGILLRKRFLVVKSQTRYCKKPNLVRRLCPYSAKNIRRQDYEPF
jgi:hypothetical protein